jgi:enamine deaminase RidA (YjgF/YER057c/UK114 family)
MSQALAAQEGELVFVSGQVPRAADGTTVGAPDDFETQARHALGQVVELVEAAGGRAGDIVSLRSYLVRREDIRHLAEIRRQLLEAPYPATTTVLVAGLADPDWLLEIEAVAVVPRSH